MANHERARSPSASRLNTNSTAASTSHHPPFNPAFALTDNALADNHYTSAGAFHDPTLFADPSFPAYQDQQNKSYQTSALAAQGNDLSFFQAQPFAEQANTTAALAYHQGAGANVPTTNPNQFSSQDTSAFPSFGFNQADYSEDAALDPAVLAELESERATLNQMAASMQQHTPTPPHLMPDMARRQSQSPSPNASPVFQQQSTFTRPRGTSDTLDPSSAMYPQHTQAEWSNMGGYRTHRRTPSDQYSDYSSHSNQASPYTQTYDSFDVANAHSSPLLDPQQDPAFSDGLGFQQFNLNDSQAQQTFHTPGHSPHISPRLPPQQQALPMFSNDNNNFVLNNDQYGQQNNGLEMFPGAGQEPFPQLHNKPQSPSDFGAAGQMSPPEINVEYAPAMGPVQMTRPNTDGEALSPPPARTQSRNRIRAKSDSYAGSRPGSPAAVAARGRSPSLQPQPPSADSLSPFPSQSRSPSPRGREKSTTRGRSASNTSENRDYVLNLADPERTPSNGVKDNGRVQKHPATFQCHLCPKRFTRAYNLRSHLRTHTDERPFVCTVCGKAFARQHDRKRHEGLHSGEKKFVCKGVLTSGAHWGCGRRFARADALGRHFRSEAGRVCIKPLLDEEAEERQRAWMEEQQQAQVAAGLVAPQPMLAHQAQMDVNANFLPAVLLQQYPALAGIDWNTLPQGPPEEDYSGRSSFEASSGGEYYDDMSGDDMGSYSDSQMGGMNGMAMQQQMNAQAQVGAQQQQQGYGAYAVQQQGAGDYLSDFEGR